jgi:hypothetical protein
VLCVIVVFVCPANGMTWACSRIFGLGMAEAQFLNAVTMPKHYV